MNKELGMPFSHSPSHSWRFKAEWKIGGENFLVMVTRHCEKPVVDADIYERQGEFRWCLYAYIYPTHRMFCEFENDSIHQKAIVKMPLHGGCSKLLKHQRGDIISAIEVGCDYHHIHDERFTYMATCDDAREVFDDAERLFNFLDKPS